jgi:hypothetical protein|tara:strand:+ start:243 stop:428 length:186 start_codon:yes stop_codon:yes gene_type:complete
VGLIRSPNLDRPDDVYEALIALQEGCDEAEALKRYGKLIICLANHIGDERVVFEALDIAKG